MNPPDTIPEVGHTIFIKHEFTESDSPSDSISESTGLATQPLGSKDGILSPDEINSSGHPGVSPSIDLGTRIKTEVDEEDYNFIDPSHVTVEISDEAHGPSVKCEPDTDSENDDVGCTSEFQSIYPPIDTCVKEENSSDHFHDVNRHTDRRSFSYDKCFPSHAEMIAHANQHVRTFTAENSSVFPRKRVKKGINLFTCSHCSAQFTRKYHLDRHTLSHTGEKPYVCSQCSKSFTQKSSLNVHLRTHTGEKPFQCIYCPTSFARKTSYIHHIRTHTGEKPFVCNECSLCFATNQSLKDHMMGKHTGEKPFHCNHCPAQFTRRFTLEQHIRTHTGEKPFSCPYCSSSFAHKPTLKEHVRQHTGERPYRCNQCSASYVSKISLKAHMFKHTSNEKPFRCNICSMAFTLQTNLTKHMARHDDENKRFMCCHCPARYSSKQNLNIHVMRKHDNPKGFTCIHCYASFTDEESLLRHIRMHSHEEAVNCPNPENALSSKHDTSCDLPLAFQFVSTELAPQSTKTENECNPSDGCLPKQMQTHPVSDATSVCTGKKTEIINEVPPNFIDPSQIKIKEEFCPESPDRESVCENNGEKSMMEDYADSK